MIASTTELTQRLYAAAIHQAGHAVAAIKLGAGNYVRSIRLSEDASPPGQIDYVIHTWPNQDKYVGEKALRMVGRRIMVRLCGPLAEAKGIGQSDEQTAEEDYQEAEKRAWQYSSTPAEWLQLLQQQTREVFTFQGKTTAEWYKVLLIAQRLMETKHLSADELLALYHQANTTSPL